MNHEELDCHLRQYTVYEQEKIKNMSSGWQDEQAFCGYKKTEAAPYLMESSQFMNPEDKIVVIRQERFMTIYPHKHDYIELCYVWSGICYQTVEGKEVVTRQGDICIFDRQAVHSVEAAGENDILINILMRPEFFDTAFLSRMTRQGIVAEFLADAVTRNRKKKHYLYFSAHKNNRVHDIMEHILLEFYTGDLGMKEILESYVNILFTELLRVLRDDSREKDSVSQEVQILELLAYIEENYEHCTLPEMGRAFGLHGNYLTALLKEKTGRSFVEHVQEQRLRKARTLLENTDIPVAELISLCGYNNMNFFYKKFKESTGMTPANYRRMFRENKEW